MSAFRSLLMKELRVEWRRRELVSAGLVLSFLILLVGNLAWADLGARALVAPGVLWVAVTFAGVLTLSRSVHAEHDRGTWDALAVLPIDRGLIFLAKTVANLAILLFVEAALLVLYGLLFGETLLDVVADLAPVLVLGTLGVASAGTLFAGIAAHGRNREILLPILLVPALFPVLMMTIQATGKILGDLGWQATLAELELLLAFDAIFITIGWLTFDAVAGD